MYIGLILSFSGAGVPAGGGGGERAAGHAGRQRARGLSLSRTHTLSLTHTHTHTLTLSLPLSLRGQVFSLRSQPRVVIFIWKCAFSFLMASTHRSRPGGFVQVLFVSILYRKSVKNYLCRYVSSRLFTCSRINSKLWGLGPRCWPCRLRTSSWLLNSNPEAS